MYEIRIKYFEGATKLEKIEQGDWIDVYSREDVILKEGDFKLVKLGFAMELPMNYEAHLAPRSSTFKKWGVIETNGVGVIDESYCGDNDEWMIPLYCLIGRTGVMFDEKGRSVKYTKINKGDKIGQFRIMEKMPKVKFNEVEVLGNDDRQGFGSTGSRKLEENK